ncbi:hypothetical protein Acr_28g0002380 [Actinidia rufa]|uniref:Uncharacterized protein n=1 Tax=Actinidia rufa TaxID=165716 RepID=A0A7J0H8V6_9ERIC|nr:hypothetical protein Acr_28g0002380 [Actinidia rufa]
MLACVAVTVGFKTTDKIGNAYGIAVGVCNDAYFLIPGPHHDYDMKNPFRSHNLIRSRYWNHRAFLLESYELDNKISPEKVKEIVVDTNFCPIPGLAIFYSELVHGILPIFKHYVANVYALHLVLIVQPNELNVFHCVVRYGYTDARNEQELLETMLVEMLKDFVREDWLFASMKAMIKRRIESQTMWQRSRIRKEDLDKLRLQLLEEEFETNR